MAETPETVWLTRPIESEIISHCAKLSDSVFTSRVLLYAFDPRLPHRSKDVLLLVRDGTWVEHEA